MVDVEKVRQELFGPRGDPQELYHRLGRLVAGMPSNIHVPTDEVLQWLGQIHDAVEQANVGTDAIELRHRIAELTQIHASSRGAAAQKIKAIIFRALARAEARCPPAVSGAFIPVGSVFDAFEAISRIARDAKWDILVLDPYLDEVFLTDFATAIPEGITLRLLADEMYKKASLEPAVRRWITQYGAARPLEAPLAQARTLHDRAIFRDGTDAWSVTQSFGHFVARAPGEIIRNTDTADLKIAAYEAIWLTAKPL
jgi:hypothetical protein